MKIAMAAAAFVLLGATGVAWTQSPEFTSDQRTEGEAKVKFAGEKLADDLKDPSSAKFRTVFIQKTVGRDGKEHVGLCGEVNAKNGYGGMNGWHNFMVVGEQVLVGGSGGVLNADELCAAGRPVVDTRDYTPELRSAFDALAGG